MHCDVCTDKKVYIDESIHKFILTSSSWRESNPDIIDISQITGCLVDISEGKEEIKKTERQADELKRALTPSLFVTPYNSNTNFNQPTQCRCIGNKYVQMHSINPILRIPLKSAKISISTKNRGIAKLYIKSGGADSPHPIKLHKTKDGKWYLWE